MRDSGTRTKVAVLGGGVGGLTAAHCLSSTTHLREQFDVTVYLPGWRLGGKGASGRNESMGARIEEHGLHVWFGFYKQSFQLLSACYQQLDRPDGHPLRSIEDAFTPVDEVVAWNKFCGQWSSYPVQLPFIDPPTGGTIPGANIKLDSPDAAPAIDHVVRKACEWLQKIFESMRARLTDADPEIAAKFHELSSAVRLAKSPCGAAPAPDDDPIGANLRSFRTATSQFDSDIWKWLAHEAKELRSDLHKVLQDLETWLDKRLKELELEVTVARAMLQDPGAAQVLLTTLDFALTCICGIYEEKSTWESGTLNFSTLQDIEFTDWLSAHGAWPETLGTGPFDSSATPALRAMYGTSFAFDAGDAQQHNGAASVALATGLRMLFDYEGSFCYRMNGSMGDVVFVPIYQALRQRGVKFKFFSAVEQLHLADLGADAQGDAATVDSITMVNQVVLNVDEYSPLIDVGGIECWPNQPRWAQLLEGETLQANGVDFEKGTNPLGRPSTSLVRGRDFDKVVLAIPPDPLKEICKELKDLTPWKEAIFGENATATVATQAFQFWFNKTLAELGYTASTNALVGTFEQPVDTVVPMDHLHPYEHWPASSAMQGVIYACGVINDSETGDDPYAHAADLYERQLHHMLPHVRKGDTPNWDVLATVRPAAGKNRLNQQYARINAEGSERYTLSSVGTISSRMLADQTGLTNVVVAGDWVKNPIDTGCVEAATLTGIAAATALCPDGLSPEQHPLDEVASYLDYGTAFTSVAAGPSTGSFPSLYGFFLEGDKQAMDTYASTTLSNVGGDEYIYEVLTNKVLMTFGHSADLRSTSKRWAEAGPMAETQVTFWMFVGRRSIDERSPEVARVLSWVPYIFVDNPISLTTGREFFGYAKNLGRIEGLRPPAPIDPKSRVEPPAELTLDFFGGNFENSIAPSGTIGAQWRRLITVTRGERLPAGWEDPVILDSLGEALTWVSSQLKGGLLHLPVSLGLDALSTISEGELHQLFIRQMRSVLEPTHAVYQALNETPLKVYSPITAQLLPYHFQIDLESFDSCPIYRELGIASQQASLAIRLDLTMSMDNGIPIYEAG